MSGNRVGISEEAIEAVYGHFQNRTSERNPFIRESLTYCIEEEGDYREK